MRIRTVEQLYDQLSNELSWRKKELSELRTLIQADVVPKHKHEVLIRSGVAMLYAHWEGFVKAAASAYLEFVSAQRLSYQELTPNFVALAMKAKLNQALTTDKVDVFIEVTDRLLTRSNDRCFVPFKKILSTRSNLSSTVLREITVSLGIEYSGYSTKEKIIDERLLKSRNTIAHGQYLIIDKDDYLELHSHIVEMIDLFRNLLDNSANLKNYRRLTNPTKSRTL